VLVGARRAKGALSTNQRVDVKRIHHSISLSARYRG